MQLPEQPEPSAVKSRKIYWQMDVIKNMGICGSPISPDVFQPMVAAIDIAAVAAGRLSGLEIKGHAIEYILGQRILNYTEVTRVLAKAHAKDDLNYVQFPYEYDKFLINFEAAYIFTDNYREEISSF